MIFEGFDDRAADLRGTQPLLLRHTLCGTDLSSDESLARLIEELPESHLQINTADSAGADTWSACVVDAHAPGGARPLTTSPHPAA